MNETILPQNEKYNYLGNMITSDGRNSGEIRKRSGMAKI